MSKCFLLINCIAGLILGATLYLLFDNTTIVTKVIYELLDIDKPIITINNDLFQFVRAYVIDLLWAYSMWFGILLCSFGFEHKAIIASIITVLFGGLVEVMQYIRLFRGTADFIDILFELVGVIIAGFVYLIYRMKGDKL